MRAFCVWTTLLLQAQDVIYMLFITVCVLLDAKSTVLYVFFIAGNLLKTSRTQTGF